MSFSNQIAAYLYIAFQSAGNSLIFHAAASWAPLVLRAAARHRVAPGRRQESVSGVLEVHTPRAIAVFIISKHLKASSLELAVFVRVIWRGRANLKLLNATKKSKRKLLLLFLFVNAAEQMVLSVQSFHLQWTNLVGTMTLLGSLNSRLFCPPPGLGALVGFRVHLWRKW